MENYTYRRKLTSSELLPALGAGAGVGIGVGLIVAYLTQISLRREPLVRERAGRNTNDLPAPERE